MSTLISALLDAIFGSLAEATGLSDRLRQLLGRDPERLAFGAALTQALTDVANAFPGRDLRYFTELLPQFAGPLLARYLQPAASLPTADELTQLWLNHLTIDSAIVYRQEFAAFATHFLDRLAFHLENQTPLQWIVQARRQRSSEEAKQRMAAAVEQSAAGVEALRQEFESLSAALEAVLQTNGHGSVYTDGGVYVGGSVRAQNFAGRDLTIKNYFVQGLPRLVIDYSSRIQDFLLEYLGSKRKRVPFGGRRQQLAELDAWLDDPTAPPYYLMSAEAGRGKSALVCRWLAQLTTRPDLEVIFVPISIRFETGTQDVVFAALAVRLARLYGEDGQLDLRSSAEQWKATCQIYLRRTPSDGKRLLVILDGLDEATGWTPTRSLFSADPPDGLRILVTARTRPGENGVGSWLNTLGWNEPQLAQATTLLPLKRHGVKEALVSMGNPLDKLTIKVDIVGELHRLSEGDPLLIRLYVDALVTQREKVHQFDAEDLQSIQPGLACYFERWWQDQLEQWRIEGRDPVVEQANLRILLNAIAAAMGPLTLDNLAMLHDGLTDSMLVRRLVTHVERWLVGDGKTFGYSFSHPRLGYHFWEQLGQKEQGTWDQRFCNWGKQVLGDLNSETLQPMDAPRYKLEEVISLAYDLEDTNLRASLLLEIALHLPQSTRQDLIKNALLATNSIGDMHARANFFLSLAPRLSARLLDSIHLFITLITDRVTRAAMLRKLLPHLPETKQTVLVDEILTVSREVPNNIERASVLIAIIPNLSEHEKDIVVDETLDTIRASNEDLRRAVALLTLTSEMAEHRQDKLVEEALDIIRMEGHKDYSRLILGPVSFFLPESQKIKVFEELLLILRNEDERYIASWLGILLPVSPTIMQEKMLHVAQTICNENSRAMALGILIQHLSANHVNQAWHDLIETKDEFSLASGLSIAAPHLPDGLIKHTLQVVNTFQNESNRNKVFSRLVGYLPEHDRKNIQKAILSEIREIEEDVLRAPALATLVPHLSEDLMQDALDILLSVRYEEQAYVDALCEIFPYLPAKLQLDVTLAVGEVRAENRAKLLGILSKQLSMLAEQMPRQCYRVLSELLSQLALHPRSEFFNDLSILMPFILALAGDEAPQAAEGIYHAIQEVCAWWP